MMVDLRVAKEWADKEVAPEAVDHPDHYNQFPVECIDVAEHMNFNLGSALKYLWRCDFKGKPIEDLEKAKWYIEREIQRRSEESR